MLDTKHFRCLVLILGLEYIHEVQGYNGVKDVATFPLTKASFVVHVSNTIGTRGQRSMACVLYILWCSFFCFGSSDLLYYVFQLTFSYCVQKLEHATWNDHVVWQHHSQSDKLWVIQRKRIINCTLESGSIVMEMRLTYQRTKGVGLKCPLSPLTQSIPTIGNIDF